MTTPMMLIANNKNIVRNLKIAGDIPPRNLEPMKTPKRINNADKGTSFIRLISIKPEGIKKKMPIGLMSAKKAYIRLRITSGSFSIQF